MFLFYAYFVRPKQGDQAEVAEGLDQAKVAENLQLEEVLDQAEVATRRTPIARRVDGLWES